jgi:hypothetical protein
VATPIIIIILFLDVFKLFDWFVLFITLKICRDPMPLCFRIPTCLDIFVLQFSTRDP